MGKKAYIGMSIIAGLIISLVFSYDLLHSKNRKTGKHLESIKESFEKRLYNFYESTIELDDLRKAKASEAKLKEAFVQCRQNFKSVEYLATYLDPSFISDFINGAPLPSLEENVPGIKLLEPEGMQRIEELIFADEKSTDELKEQNNLIKALRANSKKLYDFQSDLYLTDRQIFEASRQQLIRIMSLGITGFDVPVRDAAIDETYISFTGMKNDVSVYAEMLEKHDKNKAGKFRSQLKKTQKFLQENKDFESFDRAIFIKDYLDPLYGMLLDVQLSLGIETIYEVSDQKQSINYMGSSMFSPELLNPYFYLNSPAGRFNKRTAELGKMIFFDPLLSTNNKRACASCHQPEKAFTDGQKKSLALDFNGSINRNAPTLVNSIFSDRFFYDLRAITVGDQVEHVITNEQEFHTDYKSIFKKLEESKYYKKEFKACFPELNEKPISRYSLSTVLSAYLSELVAFNSPVDQYLRNETSELEPAVKRGFNIFMGKGACATCHFPPTYSGLVPPLFHENETEVLGVPANADTTNPVMDEDPGRIAGRDKEAHPIYLHSFKTTTVRNVKYTAPYMHNGVYKTLEEVVDFYNMGGGAGLGFELENQTLPPDRLGLSDQEKSDLIEFMKALSDTSGLTSKPKFLPEVNSELVSGERVIGGEY